MLPLRRSVAAAVLTFATDTAETIRGMVSDAAVVGARFAIFTHVASIIVIAVSLQNRTSAESARGLTGIIGVVSLHAQFRLFDFVLPTEPRAVFLDSTKEEWSQIIVLAFTIGKRINDWARWSRTGEYVVLFVATLARFAAMEKRSVTWMAVLSNSFCRNANPPAGFLADSIVDLKQGFRIVLAFVSTHTTGLYTEVSYVHIGTHSIDSVCAAETKPVASSFNGSFEKDSLLVVARLPIVVVCSSRCWS